MESTISQPEGRAILSRTWSGSSTARRYTLNSLQRLKHIYNCSPKPSALTLTKNVKVSSILLPQEMKIVAELKSTCFSFCLP